MAPTPFLSFANVQDSPSHSRNTVPALGSPVEGGPSVSAARAILVDLDGVIRLWSPDNDRLAETAGNLPPGAIQRAAFSQQLLFPAITGRITDRQWREQIVARLRADHPGADAERAVELWSESPGAVDFAVLEVLRRCRRMCRVVLVTNATSRLADDLHRLGIDDEFDAVINSSDVGFAKPQPEIYMEALAAAGVPASAAVFVDDSEPNVAAAVGLGMIGHVYRGVDALRQHVAQWIGSISAS